MGSIFQPRFAAGQRVTYLGRPATVLRNGSQEGSCVFVFDDCPDDEYHTHERNLSPLIEPQPAKEPKGTSAFGRGA
jgi:hypothetical protein